MPRNSASPNDSLHLSSINSSLPPYGPYCLMSKPISLVFAVYTVTIVLFLLPLCILILYHGFQQWRRQCSSSTAPATTHADSFTYHIVTMEMIFVFGCIICCFGIHMNHVQILRVGTHLLSFTWYGERFFHILTCVEYYLAVVHPIIYLGLRKQKGIRIRNTCIGIIWLLCFGFTCLIYNGNTNTTVMLCLLASSLIIISYCSLSVLCVLIRPGPGDQGRDRGRADKLKQRAFYTIVAILGVLLMRCTCNLILAMLYALNVNTGDCVTVMCEVWLNLLSSFLLPLLFLQRVGILASCKMNIR